MRIRSTPTIACLLLALVGACKEKRGAGTSSTEMTSASDQPRADTPRPGEMAAPLSKDDKEFITKAAAGSAAEVTLGDIATKKGAAPDVKAFGHQMSVDHTRVGDELKQLAAQKGATLPSQPDDDEKKEIDKLSNLSGKAFDKKYSTDMVDDHEKDVKEFQKAEKDLKDPDLRAWAAKTLPVLEKHLAMAKDMKAKQK